VPILNSTGGGPLGGHLANRGITYVLDQVFRIALHGRMQYGMERYQKENPGVDILLIQPTRDDMHMFRYNIMRYDARRIVAEDGYRSVRAAFLRNRRQYARVLARHGIAVKDPARLRRSRTCTLPLDAGPRPFGLAGPARRKLGALDAPPRRARSF